MIITYNFETQDHQFYLLELNFDEIMNCTEKTEFEKMIQVLDIQDENFMDKYYTIAHYLNLTPIFSDSKTERPADKIVVSELVFEKDFTEKRRFGIYLHFEPKSLVKVFSLVFELSSNKNKCFITETVQSAGLIENVQDLWALDYFPEPKTNFKIKNHFESDKNKPENKPNFLAPVENNEEMLTFSTSKFEKYFYKYVNMKVTKSFMNSRYSSNVVLIKRPGNVFHLYVDSFSIFDFTIDSFLDSSFKVERIKNKSVFIRDANSSRSKRIPIPEFKDELIHKFLDISRVVLDKGTFFHMLSDLYKNYTFFKADAQRLKRNNYASSFGVYARSERELLFCYLGCLFMARHQPIDALQPLFEHINKKVPSNIEDAVSIYGSYFNALIKQSVGVDERRQLLDMIGYKASVKLSTPVNKEARHEAQSFMPIITVDLNELELSKLKLFQYLHHLNEDLRLCQHNTDLLEGFTTLLYILAGFVEERHLEHYLKLQPMLVTHINNNEVLKYLAKFRIKDKKVSASQTDMQSEAAVFDVFEFIKMMLQGNVGKVQSYLNNLPLFFENTYNIVKMLSIVIKANFKGKKFGTIPTPVEAPKTTHRHLLYTSNFEKYFNTQKFIEKRKREFINRCRLKDNNYKLFDRIFYFFINNKIDMGYIESLQEGLQYVYKNLLRLTRKEINFFVKNPYLHRYAYELLQREDIYANQLVYPSLNEFRYFSHQSMISNIRDRSASLFAENNYVSINQKSIRGNESNVSQTPMSKIDGQKQRKAKNTIAVPKYSSNDHKQPLIEKNLHYSKADVLFKELYKYFDVSGVAKLSSKSVNKIFDDPSLGEEMATAQLQSLLQKQLASRLSGFVGRGALDLNTEGAYLTEVIAIPEPNLSGRIKEKSMTIAAVFNPEEPKDRSVINWAEFHNGVAAGLRISRRAMEGLERESLRTWIDYQRTDSPRHDHAGLLYGLGLQGLFNCFTIADIYFNLNTGVDARIVAVLLGLAASKLGAKKLGMEEIVLKAFNLHLEFNYARQSEVQISRIVQSAAMIGIGIYHLGMSKKQLNEKMIAQIAATPFNENNENRECHSLAAGFALGLINLNNGSNVPLVKEVKLDEMLFRYIEGGELIDEVRDFQASNVLETKFINTTITAPSALIALALIHLKSDNKNIADRISLPNTLYDITKCNPQLILLKSIARGLINWSYLSPTQEFISSCVPETVSFLNNNSFEVLIDRFDTNANIHNLDFHNLALVYFNGIAGSLLACAIKYSGMKDSGLRDIIISWIHIVEKVQILEDELCTNRWAQNKLDLYTFCNVLAVLSLSLGISIAGSCDVKSFQILKAVRKTFKKHENKLSTYGFEMAVQIAIGFVFLGNGAYTFGSDSFQIACLLMSVYPVFPVDFNDNRFHLQALRHFYVLATQENLFNLIDVDLQKPLKLNVQLESVDTNGKTIREQVITPLNYKTLCKWRRLKVIDEGYHSLDFTFNDNLNKALGKPRFLFVKKKHLHEVDLVGLKRLLDLPSAVLRSDLTQIISSSSYLESVLNKLKVKDFWTNEQTHQTVNETKYLINCIYQVLKRDKASFAPIVYRYFLNEKIFNKFEPQKNQRSFSFNLNGDLIFEFSKFIDAISNRKQQSSTLSANRWNEKHELFLLKQQICKAFDKEIVACRPAFKIYMGMDTKSAVIELMNDLTLDSLLELRTLMNYLYFRKVKHAEDLAGVLSCVNSIQTPVRSELAKALLDRRGIMTTDTLVKLLLS